MARLLLGLALLFVALVRPVSATVTIPRDFREIVTSASLIVRGRVTDVRATAVGPDTLQSVATLAVSAVLKGDAGPFVSVMVPGGELGRTRTVMVGAPRLRVDDVVVLFLKRGPDNVWRLAGMTSGIARVQNDPRTGRAMVNSPVMGGITAPAGRVVRGDARRRPLALSEFDSLVRLAMRPQERQRPRIEVGR